MDGFDFQDPHGDMLFKTEQFEDTFMGVNSDFNQLDNSLPNFQQGLQHPQPHHQQSQQYQTTMFEDSPDSDLHGHPFAQVHSQSQSPDFHNTNAQQQAQIHGQQQQQQQRNDSQKRTRASGEVLALLISEFNKNQNPNAVTRKKISEQTGMPERSVRIWFQNRRAKSRKMEKAAANSDKEDPYAFANKNVGFSRYDQIPLTLNNNYFFIDAKSLTVGSWKRLKSGNLSNDNIFNVKNLSNLSPQSINEIMTNSTDLMLIISKKNFEINYFFSAITDNSKILFRIFYPISSVNDCSISVVQDDESKEQSCELKLHLNKPPKFAVSFSHLIVQNNNQWSICDDFSEGHQVNDAFIGGSGIPHVFNGLGQSLKFMNSFILDYNSSNVSQPEFELPRPDSRSPTRFPISLHQARKATIDDDHGYMDQSPVKHENHENPLLQQFVQDSVPDFDKFIQQPDEEFDNF